MQKRTSRTTKPAPPSVSYEALLIEQLKDPEEAAAYIEAAIEDGDQAVLMLALRHVAQALGGVSEIARKSKLTREATYRMLSKTGNPELRSLTAILGAAGLRLSVKPILKHATRTVKRARAKTRDSSAIVDWSKAERVRMPNLKPTPPSRLRK